MFARILFGSVFTAVVSFMLGFVWWMVTDFPYQVIHALPDADATALASLPETGVYFYPWRKPNEGEDRFKVQEELEPKRAKGPVIQMLFTKEGIEGGPEFYVGGFSHGLLSALFAAGILAMVSSSLPNYLSRVWFVFLLGLFASVVIYGSDLVWMHHPWKWVAFQAGFTVSNWLLAGIILGAFVRPPPPQPVVI